MLFELQLSIVKHFKLSCQFTGIFRGKTILYIKAFFGQIVFAISFDNERLINSLSKYFFLLSCYKSKRATLISIFSAPDILKFLFKIVSCVKIIKQNSNSKFFDTFENIGKCNKIILKAEMYSKTFRLKITNKL